MVRISTVAVRAETIVSSGRVYAIRSEATNLSSFCALIDVRARSVVLSAIPLGAGAVAEATGYRDAFRPFRTLTAITATRQNALATNKLIRWLALALQTVTLLAAQVGVAIKAWRTVTLVASGKVLAQRVSSARPLSILGALVDIAALLRGLIAHKTLSADAHVGAQVSVLDAGLTRGTRVIVAACNVNNIVLCTSIAVRVSSAATWTLARVTSRTVGADRTTGTRIPNAFVNVNTGSTKLSRCSRETLCTKTLGHIVDDHALGVRGTGHSFARMAAVIADVRFRAQTPLVLITNGVSGTFIISRTGHHGNTSDPWIGIRDRTRWTGAIERTGQVVAHSSLAACVRFTAFVQIRTKSFRISCESGRTLA